MSKTKRMVSLAVLFALLVSLLVVIPGYAAEEKAPGASFADVARTHWAKDYIDILTEKGIINGVSPSQFMPEEKVTRAEFLKMLVFAFSVPLSDFEAVYSDVPEGAWFAQAVCSAYRLGMIDENMTGGGAFLPHAPIKREEAAALAVAAFEGTGSLDEAKAAAFSDEKEVSPWALEYVDKASALGLVTGTNTGFEPKRTMTRAEAATIILRMLQKREQTIYYVDGTNGDDNNNGTEFAPFKTIEKARDVVRTKNKNMAENIYVLIREGRYMLDRTLELRDEDSGRNGYDVIYKGFAGEQVSISGGKTVTGWELHDAEKNIYKAPANGIITRHLYINGNHGVRARSEEGTFTNPEMDKSIGYRTPDTYIAGWKNITDVEMVFTPKHSWSDRRLGIQSVERNGDEEIIIKIKDLAWDMAVNQSNSGHAPVTLRQYENAYELLDTEGEWYLNTKEDTFYYKPLAGEDMQTADVVASVLEKVVWVFGRSYDTPAHNIRFENLLFEHGEWMNPTNIGGHFNNQSNMNVLEKFTSFPGNVMVERANNIDFIECEITKMATTALQFMDGVQDVEIIGCHIHNVAASGLHIGDQRYTNPSIANPPEPEQRLRGFTVNNNYIHDIGQDFFASCGVVLGFVGDAEFRHNELYNMPYSGYHIGYGFGEQGATALGNITVANNYIHDVMMKLVDGGYIYTNGSTQGNDPIELDFHENYCYNSGGTTTIALYNDTGTDYCTWNNNVVNIINTTGMMAVGNSSARVPECYYKNTYTTHDYVYGDIPSKEKAWGDVYLYPDANWPEEAMEIIAKSGLEEEYQYLVEMDDSLNMVTTESVLLMDSGDTASVGLKAYTDRGKACNVSGLDVTYTSDDETIASVDANGMITAVSQGKVNITATAAEGDFTQTRTTEVYVDDHFDRVIMDDMSDRLVVGAEIYTKLAGETKFGRPVAVTASIKSSDPDILSVDEKGVIRALKQGEGHVEITGEYEGKSITSVYTISVMDYSDQSGTEYPEHSIEGIIKSTEGWELMSENGSITPTVDGLQFATPAGYALYTQEQYQDELFTFDLTLTGGSWPSIAFRQQANLGYADAGNALYMLSFSKGTVDLQRFNRGVRTGILYSGAADIITGGPALPLALERGKTYKVQAGAINEENGVRIIVNIDGKNVINFLDTVEGCIKEPGYFGVYCTSGSMDFAPAE